MSRRGKGEGTMYREGRYWVVELSWTDGTGSHRLRRKRKSRTEAFAARDALRAQVTAGTAMTGDAAKVTVAEAVRRYLDEAEQRVSSRTLRDYRRIGEGQIIPGLGLLRAHLVRRSHVVRFLAGVNGARAKQLAYVISKAAIGPYVRAVDPLEHPFPPRSAPKAPRRPVEPFAADTLARILAAVKGHPLEALYVLAPIAAVRQSELLGLRWCDVGPDHISISQRLDERTRTVGRTKTAGSRRRVDLPQAVSELLRSHQAASAARGLPTGASDLVFLNGRGRPILASNLRRQWRALRRMHGIDASFRFYDMRHLHASILASAGVVSKAIAERLGHASTRLTDDTYSHFMPGMQSVANDVIGRALRSATADDER